MRPRERILVIEDERNILELIAYNLTREGYQVSGAPTGEEGLRQCREEHPDLVLLDLMLPGIDGLEVCRRLKAANETRHIPVIMVTAKGEEADVVTGLEIGADDYLAKPFSPRVMVARVRAVLRRREEPSEAEADVMNRGALSLHRGRREVRVNGELTMLTYTEFELLWLLARRPGWVLTRDQIVNAVRGADYHVTDRAVDVQVVGLRRKLGAAGERIETVRGVGYRFKE
jgi:two-component system phosphate regulon response regulator PhoB